MKFIVKTSKDFEKKCKNDLIKDFHTRMIKGNESTSIMFGFFNQKEIWVSDIFNKLGDNNFIKFEDNHLIFGNEGANIMANYDTIIYIQVKEKVE